MPHRRHFYLFFCAVILIAVSAAAQAGNGEKGVINFVTPILPDPVLQHSKETYVLFGCAYCHDVDLHIRNGEAADLMHSTLVGKDQNGDFIGAVLRVGIPQTAKLSPMPQFSDLSDREIADIVQWIHYARQQGRYAELTVPGASVQGSADAGKTYFAQSCGSCHSATGDLAGIGKKYDAATLKIHILRPEFVDVPKSWKVDQLHDTKDAAARQNHLALLENYTPADVANLVAYLQTTK
jgi:mono/diheme cytochrome c family protein